ncbi:hypothetical protein [Nonlabens ponticola]|uniref:Outer membrane protein beta-barrel domain-containing protein n=1 Tax=Nonlabens ponticola TaxID=2496866 RepID=A0A3S9MW99_9FLAO|nr:hypothetical protein [Nonlabens ponticola]AZQ43414.1 hypothetical protein EJ995_03880 [Nonlabens ponticola]
MKHVYALVLLLLATSTGLSQDQNKLDYADETIFRLNVLTPSAEVEHDITENFSLLANVGVGLSITVEEINNETESDFLFPLILEGSGRYYTNFNRRLEKGRNIQYNSGNFIGLNLTQVIGVEGDISRVDDQTVLSATYGLQRTYQDFLNFTFEAGPSYDLEDSDVSLYIGVQIGFTL